MTTELLRTHARDGPPATAREESDAVLSRLAELPPECAERERLRARVVAAKLPLAVSLARRYLGKGEPYEDLRQVAAVGLVKAVDRYDPHRGVSFATYATPTILGELRRHFRDCAWSVRVPRPIKDMRQNFVHAAGELAQRLRHTPGIAELAEHLDITQDQAQHARIADAAYTASSLDSAGTDDLQPQSALGELDPRLERIADKLALSRLIARLPKREQRILALRFFHNMTQSQIGAEVGLSQMHVSRLLRRARERLRQALLDEPTGWPAPTIWATRVNVRRFDNGRVLVSTHGRLDLDTARELRHVLSETVRQAAPRLLVIDLAQTCAIGRVGAAALAHGRRVCGDAAVRVVLVNVRPSSRRALREAGFATEGLAATGKEATWAGLTRSIPSGGL